MTNISDLEREFHQRRVADYRRLQERAAAVAFEHKHGRAPADLGELSAAFKSGTIATVDPCRHLDAATIAGVLTTATG